MPVREEPASKPVIDSSKPDAVDQSVHLTAGIFAAGGLAYDAVSHRFVVGDLHGRKLMGGVHRLCDPRRFRRITCGNFNPSPAA